MQIIKCKISTLGLSSLVMIISLTFCAIQSFAKDMTAQDFIAEAKEHITEMPLSEAKERFDQCGLVILDCRMPREFKMGHIPGSINIPRGVLEFAISKKISDKNTKIINYCKKGNRGCLTTYTMYRMGYKNAVNMVGGFEAWKIAGYPVSKQ